MARRGLTPIKIENLRPDPAKRIEVPDPGASGLYVVVQPSGRRALAVRCRVHGRPAKITLPAGTTLAEARKEAAAILAEAKQGRDPAATRRSAKTEAKAAAANTLCVIAESYLKLEGAKLRTFAQRENIFRRLIFPVLGDKPIAEIRRSDVVKLLDKVEAESGPKMADEVLVAIRRLFNWYAIRDEGFRSPLVRGMARSLPAHERARTRVLDDGEVRAVWAAAMQMGTAGAFLRFLLLTSARRNEAADMAWGELQGLDWCLPAARNKTKVGLVRPLSGAALAVLADVPRIEGSDFVFQPLPSFARLKDEIDRRSGVSGWCFHDLRRSARSLMSRAGVNADHAERVLGHIIGGIIRQTYDRHEFYNEKKHALAALAAEVERIINPPADNVVALAR